MSYSSTRRINRVAIIGAGPGGVAAARYVLSSSVPGPVVAST